MYGVGIAKKQKKLFKSVVVAVNAAAVILIMGFCIMVSLFHTNS